MKNIVILGSTGSIGKNALEIARRFPEEFKVIGLSANKNVSLIKKQIEEFKPEFVCITSKEGYEQLKKNINYREHGFKLLSGEKGLTQLVKIEKVDIVLIAVVGFSGFLPTVEALKQNKTVALANKESLVVGGEIISKIKSGKIIPVDSEHSAIFQCLRGENIEEVKRLILTASGGAFFKRSIDDFKNITVKEALKHPNWSMGPKITVDSSTMMNKGLEVIEAHYLFKIPPEKIEVVIHPQSIIHSMVEFVDGSIISQMGITDMKLPIGFALFYPGRKNLKNKNLDLFKVSPLEFFPPDFKKFPCLKLAFEALKSETSDTIVLNSANEVAVESFLKEEIRFSQIPIIIEKTLNKVNSFKVKEVEDVMKLHTISTEKAKEIVKALRGK